VWSDVVVVAAPSLDQHPGFFEAAEDLAVEQLIPELAVEALVLAVLPGAAGRDIERFHRDPTEPVSDRLGRELAAVGGPDVIRRTMADKELGQDLQHVV